MLQIDNNNATIVVTDKTYSYEIEPDFDYDEIARDEREHDYRLIITKTRFCEQQQKKLPVAKYKGQINHWMADGTKCEIKGEFSGSLDITSKHPKVPALLVLVNAVAQLYLDETKKMMNEAYSLADVS